MSLHLLRSRSLPRLVCDDTPLRADQVGGKLARLRTLGDARLNVPPFFCLTRHAFDAAFAPARPEIEHSLRALDWTNAANVRDCAALLQRRVCELPFDPALAHEVLACFDRKLGPQELVAVRASMVGQTAEESEDSASQPFAGISETFLCVRRHQLLDRIRACWASGFSEQALLYRHAQGLPLLGFGVAVGVQRMILGSRSFVLFTVNPKNGTRDQVIVAGHGLGEGVVQERVAVDHYFVNARTRTITRELSDKAEQLLPDLERGGVVEAPVSEPLRRASCLSDAEITRLVQDGERISALFGGPQDIEGCFDAQGKLYYLQARPIVIDYQRLSVWTNANVTESFPGVTSALTYSMSRMFYRVIFYDCYRRLGYSARALHDAHDAHLDRMIGLLEGRVYYNLNAFYHLHSQSPLFPLFRAHWESMMGFRSSYRPAPESAVERLRQGAALAHAALRVALLASRHKQAMRRFYTRWQALIAPVRAQRLEDLDPLSLVREYQRVWRAVGNEWGVTLLNDTFLPVLYGWVEALFRSLALDADRTLLSDLLCGDERLRSVDIVLSAVRLAERVRAQPELRARFAHASAEQLWQQIEAGELDPEFCAAVREHLTQHGDRSLMELKLEQPSLRDAPAPLLVSVQDYVNADVSVAGLRQRERELRRSAEQRLRARLVHRPLQLAALRLLLPALRALIRHRENSRYCRSELFGFSKRVFRALGAALVRRGVLSRTEDVFHLTQDEVFGYLDGTGVTEDLAGLVALRRRELAVQAKRETPVELSTLGPVRDNQLNVPPSAAVTAGALLGIGSSAGRARGRARVILDPSTVRRLDPDTILVARETDPGWMFLMLAARAIVVERGSMLSHTAITGRKFGIPTVVAVADATRRIQDGALVEVDGASGSVTILESSATADQPELQA